MSKSWWLYQGKSHRRQAYFLSLPPVSPCGLSSAHTPPTQPPDLLEDPTNGAHLTLKRKSPKVSTGVPSFLNNVS